MAAASAPSGVPSAFVGVAALAAAFFGGPWIGLAIARWLVPGSGVAEVVSFLVLPLAMVLGLQAWLGLAIVLAIGRLALDLVSGRTFVRRPASPMEVPSGSFVFVPIALVTSATGGAVCAVLPSSRGVILVLAVYLAVGAAYGAALWGLARSGVLPFPDGD